MTTLAANTPAEAWEFFKDHTIVLLLMPVIGAFIGWITKVLAIWMVFNPIEFKGIGPIGWQGQLPKRAAKFGSHASELVLENLIDPRSLVDKLDPDRIAAELDEVMLDVIDDIARDAIGDRWDQLPDAAKAPVIARARSRAPEMVANLLRQSRENIDELFDLSYITTANLIRDKELLNELVADTIIPEQKFMKKFGTIFGAAVGFAQMILFVFTESHLIIPIAGLLVGLVSDWIALQMVFKPRKETTYLGLFTWHGLFFKRREEFAADYARLAAEKVLTPQVILDSLLNGPLADRLFGMVRNEVNDALDRELGVAQPLVPAAVGSDRYNSLRDIVVTRSQERLPEAAARLEAYTAEAIDIEATAKQSLSELTDEEYEGMLRPVFKDDEWLVVAVGGGLGFLVGELQLQILSAIGGI